MLGGGHRGSLRHVTVAPRYRQIEAARRRPMPLHQARRRGQFGYLLGAVATLAVLGLRRSVEVNVRKLDKVPWIFPVARRPVLACWSGVVAASTARSLSHIRHCLGVPPLSYYSSALM